MATPEAAGFSALRLQRLTDALSADITGGALPGAVVLILRDDKMAYFEALGYADRQNLRPMRRDCIFRIASMTKPLTVAAALILLEQGKLLLGDPVSRAIPELGDLHVGVESADSATGERSLSVEPVVRPMTIQDLMRHTAGFTYGHLGDSLVQRRYRSAHLLDNQQTNADMVAKLSQLPLAHQPGTTFEYGMSTDVLGRVVEVVSGVGLDRFFAEHITRPLGMMNTAFSVSAAEAHLLAEPQRDSAANPGPAVISYDPARPSKWFSGGGGLLSTAGDYARFCRMLLNGGESAGARILSRKTVEWMTHNHLPPALRYGDRTAELGLAAPLPRLGQGYGLGVGVRMEQGLSPVPGSVGDYYWGGSSGTYFWVDPREKLIVVAMMQELNAQRRARFRSSLRSLVYQALR
jgi:CubicO group peptidase (beta-lactamase class C family)